MGLVGTPARQPDVSWIAKDQDVGLQALNGHHPAQLTEKIPALRLGKDAVKRLPVSQPGRCSPLDGLGELLSTEGRGNRGSILPLA